MKSRILTVAAFGLASAMASFSGLHWGAAIAQTTPEATTETAPEAATEAAGEAAAGAAAETAEAPATAGGYSINSSLADVDGVTLTLGELIAIRRELPDQYQSLPDEVLFDGIIEQMIDQMLLAEAGRKAGLDKRPAVAFNLLNQHRAIMADAYLRAEVEARATPEAVEALYAERYVNAEPQDEVRAGHILVAEEAKAIDLKAQLDGGADFAALAAEHGTDGTATRGGDLGWFVRSDMVPAFADAAFAMEPGTVSDPVKSDFGWHLIKVDERRPRPAPPLEEVQEALLGEVIQQAQLDVVKELREAAVIVKPDPPLPPQSIREDAMLDAAE